MIGATGHICRTSLYGGLSNSVPALLAFMLCDARSLKPHKEMARPKRFDLLTPRFVVWGCVDNFPVMLSSKLGNRFDYQFINALRPNVAIVLHPFPWREILLT